MVPEVTTTDLATADGFIFAFGARFGAPPAQMLAFFDTTGGLWTRGSLVGKPGAVCVSNWHTAWRPRNCSEAGMRNAAASRHGVCWPTPRELNEAAAAVGPGGIVGGSPWGAGTIAAPTGERTVQPAEQIIAQNLGFRVASLASRLTFPYR